MLGTIYHSSKKKFKKELDHVIKIGDISVNSITKGTKYVSFDIFDTLIVRDVNKPVDIFKILEIKTKIKGFAQKRIEAEQKARELNSNGEVTLPEIYRVFDGISPEKIDYFCRLELSAELGLCHAKPNMLQFFNDCKKYYKVILISDMYLKSDMIEILLYRCGITGYEKLYISCEAGLSKGGSGALFDYVSKDLSIGTNEITHIGNDISSDVINARRKGLNVIKIRTKENNLISRVACPEPCRNSEEFRKSIIYNFINNTTHDPEDKYDFYYRFGYENLGVLLWGFCKWLLQQMHRDGVEQVLFVARDGYMIKKIYDKMMGASDIPSYYFEMSRRSIRVAASFSNALSYEEMLELMPLPSRSSIEQIFDAWGLPIEQYIDVYTSFGVEKGEIFWTKNLKTNGKIRQLYEKLRKDIIENAADEYNKMLAYTEQFSLWKKTAFVDIGWGATIQKELLKALKKAGISSEIYGYYIALDQRTSFESESIDFRAKGYIWDNYNGSGDMMEEKCFVGLFESFFLENEGSVKRYIEADGRYIAERYPYEYLLPGGILDETSLVRKIQKGAEDFVVEIGKCYAGSLNSISGDSAFCFMRDCLMRPTTEVLKRFGDFRFFNSGEEIYLAKPKRCLMGYGMHPKEMIADFYESQWKIGFFKALFKLDMPYEQLWRFLKLIFPEAPV
ncbi:HAD family hydrolase [Ruminococcus flavefaciens]|uniref:HAD family hydrolase n=1 Tax=Ruminococcus flavefaciens TaxID=1265 RepID=UPI0002EEC5EE|nr:hypothetical protein [Ruminococcus flavefaciens]